MHTPSIQDTPKPLAEPVGFDHTTAPTTAAPETRAPASCQGVEAHLPDDIRAYYWELERQLGLRQRQLDEILGSDDYHDRPVNPVRAETIRILRREIELLDKAWAHPPFTIKDWDDLPASLGLVDEAHSQWARPLGIGRQRQLRILEIIRELGLDPLAIRPGPQGKSGDKARIKGRYLENFLSNCEARKTEATGFENAWEELKRGGRRAEIKNADPPKF